MSLPADLECLDCSIRLVRQASEWGKRYQFWSCADVNIMPPASFSQVGRVVTSSLSLLCRRAAATAGPSVGGVAVTGTTTETSVSTR